MSLLIRGWAIALTGYRQVFDGVVAATNRLLLENANGLLLEDSSGDLELQ